MDSDSQLMVEVSRGNKDAFAELFKKYHEPVFRFTYRFCQNEEAAADLTQETFLRVFAAASRYNPKSRFITYLYRIATNLCLNELRAARRHPTVHLDASRTTENDAVSVHNVPSAEPTPAEYLQQKELEQHVKQVIARLPEKQRIAVILRRYHDMSYEHIADVLECSAGAVDGLLQRARQTLKTHLREYANAK